MSIIRYQSPDLFRSLDRWASLRDEINSLFDSPFLGSGGMQQAQLFNGWAPAMDLYQTSDDIVAVVELPGMRKEDIDISLHDGMLTVSGERRDETPDKEKNAEESGRSERFVGKFRRSIALPTRIDAGKVNATYKDGILTITLPKAEEVKPKQIKVKAA